MSYCYKKFDISNNLLNSTQNSNPNLRNTLLSTYLVRKHISHLESDSMNILLPSNQMLISRRSSLEISLKTQGNK